MTKFVSRKIKMKSSARLAAVQANYEIALSQLPVDVVIEDFISGKTGRFTLVDSSDDENMEQIIELGPIDSEYFAKLVRGAQSKKEELEKSLNHYLHGQWAYEKMNDLMRALLLSAIYELTSNFELDSKIIIQEYVDLAYAFFSKNEPKMVNAVLDQIAHSVRM